VLTDEDRYKILKRLSQDPGASQRLLAQELGLSLGKVNYCLKALIEKGLLKVNNFRTSDNKRAYMYYLTPNGLEEKSRVTMRFLGRKLAEYQELREEISRLQSEAQVEMTQRPSASVENRGAPDFT
jgi:EPS-associated MarR family transcriptional regulator